MDFLSHDSWSKQWNGYRTVKQSLLIFSYKKSCDWLRGVLFHAKIVHVQELWRYSGMKTTCPSITDSDSSDWWDDSNRFALSRDNQEPRTGRTLPKLLRVNVRADYYQYFLIQSRVLLRKAILPETWILNSRGNPILLSPGSPARLAGEVKCVCVKELVKSCFRAP